jgi:phage replication-related protein YjqB (UPF0714/DUF867 family)
VTSNAGKGDSPTSENTFRVIPYRSFAELAQHEQEGRDYRIRHHTGPSGVLVMAPHGGGIEPGTGDIADALSGSEHAFYGFKGLKKRGNHILHIASTRFDEPLAVRMLKEARWVLTIHGCRDRSPVVWVGGRDGLRGDTIIKSLEAIGIPVRQSEAPGLRGLQPENVCNRGRLEAGVQLEISRGLREMLFADPLHRPCRCRTPLFFRFAATVRGCLRDAAGY